MKKIKRISFLLLLIFSLITLVSCETSANTFTVTFVDYDDSVIEVQTVEAGSSAKKPSNPNRFGYTFSGWDKEFDNVLSDLTIKATYYEGLKTPYTDKLKMDFSPSDKSFVTDGIGEVRLNRVVDGDTISVYASGISEAITIRFLSIDTPESTSVIEAWGKAASSYAKRILNSATSIVLEAEGERKDTNGRYLAWVWYRTSDTADYRLFNLEEVEMAYTKYVVRVDSKYHDYLKDAADATKTSGIRVWGETDPNFNYSKDSVPISLLSLQYNHDLYQDATYFYVTVKLVRTVGNNMYLEDAEEQTLEINNGAEIVTGKGAFYAFGAYATAWYRTYKIGDVFNIRCQLQWDGDYGTQLTGLSRATGAFKNEAPVIEKVDANSLSDTTGQVKNELGEYENVEVSGLVNYYGRVIELQNLKCVKINKRSDTTSSYYTVVMENSNGIKFDVHFSSSLISSWQVESRFTVGKYYNVTGGVTFYQYANGYYQVSVGDAPRYNNGVLNELDAVRVNDVVEISDN